MKRVVLVALFIQVLTGVQAQEDSVHSRQAAASIISTYPKRWVKPLIAAGYAGATWLTYRYLDADIQKISQRNKGGLPTFVSRSVTKMGLGRTQTIALGATALTSLVVKDKKLQSTVIIWAGSLLLNSVVTDQLKTTFQRHRPNSGDPPDVFDWRHGPGIHTSFPSAHTSNIFTTATVFATLYHDHRWVPPVAYGLASLVGLSRIYDNAHWASDVMTGAAIGFLSAKSMTAIYKWAGKKITFLPQASHHSASLLLICQL